MNKGVAIYVMLVITFGFAAWAPVFASYVGWIADETVTYFALLTGPPFGFLLIGQDLLLQRFLETDLTWWPQITVWLLGSFLYYGVLFGPGGAILAFTRGKLSQWRDHETLIGVQFFLIVLHCFAAYLALIMLRT